MRHQKRGSQLAIEPAVGSPGRERWDEEYNTHAAIPSSHRSSPSKALVAASAAIDYPRISNAIDVGCGNGRNSIYLAKRGINTVAVDFSDRAIEIARERFSRSKSSGSIDIVQGDVSRGLPFKASSADLVVDSYTSCHFLDDNKLTEYFSEVERVLRSDGQFYWSALSLDDQYYSEISDTHPDENVIIDPLNDLPKRLYEKSEIRTGLPTSLEINMTLELSFTDIVDEKEYIRSIIAGVFEK